MKVQSTHSSTDRACIYAINSVIPVKRCKTEVGENSAAKTARKSDGLSLQIIFINIHPSNENLSKIR